MLIRANEVSGAELCHLVRVSAPELLGQTRFDQYLLQHDISLTRSLVVTHRGAYVGVALLGERQLRLHLCVLAVHREYRSLGLGSALLEAALSCSAPHPLSLDVLSRNVRALKLYYSYGFTMQRSSLFWYRSLPIRWESTCKGRVHALAPDIALSMSELPSLAWGAQSRSLRRKLPLLRGAVYMEQGGVRGVALFSAGLDNITVYRFSAVDKNAAKALVRHMHLVTPSASAIYLRWMQGEELSTYLRGMGLRCHSEFYTLQI